MPLETATDPLVLFQSWFEEAGKHPGIKEPSAMALATASKNAIPSVRMVLLKQHDERGFAFFTNMESNKSRELSENPHASLCFYWMPLDKQVRITGKVERASEAEADAYFASRGREKQIGAWSSQQSRILSSQEELKNRVTENEKRFEGKDIPRPDFWAGWRLVPGEMEFWLQRDFRLHERAIFKRDGDAWKKDWLYP